MKILKKNKHIFFVGIGGIGMSGIAEVLINQGYQVSNFENIWRGKWAYKRYRLSILTEMGKIGRIG